MTVGLDFRQFVDLMREKGELITVKREVDALNFELASYIRHAETGLNRAIYFEKVKGYDMPAVGNLYGSLKRMMLGFGIEVTPEDIGRLREDPHSSPGGLAGHSLKGFTVTLEERVGAVILKEKLIDAARRAAAGEMRARIVSDGPCKEVRIADRERIDLPGMLPVPWQCEGDVGPFINPAGLVVRDPDTGVLNIGVRRHQVTPKDYGKTRMGAFIVRVSDGYKIMDKYHQQGKPCPVALCIGLDPITELLGCYTPPAQLDPKAPYSEFDMASVLQGRPLELVRCDTVDLEVPSHTEIVVEGYIPANQTIYEGPMAEFTDMFAQKGHLPFIEVTAITHRRNPIYHVLQSGRSQEHITLGLASGWAYEVAALERFKRVFPTVQDAALFPGSHDFHLVVSMKQMHPGHDRELLHYLIGTTFHKYITVIDDDIDPHDAERVEWARAMRAGKNVDDFVIFPRTHTWEMDPEIDENHFVTRLGVLATLPYGERFKTAEPPTEMLETTRAAFDEEVRASGLEKATPNSKL